MDAEPKEITKAIKNLKPNYKHYESSPIFENLLVFNSGKVGVMACIDFDKNTGYGFVKSTYFACDGPDSRFTIRPRILRDIAKLSDETISFNPNKRTVNIQADGCSYRLSMIDPDDFPGFSPEDTNVTKRNQEAKATRVYQNRMARIKEVLYATTHWEEYRHSKCLSILSRMEIAK